MALGRNINRKGRAIPDGKCDSEGRVFLTGATGFMGSHLLVELLALPQVKTVACPVRDSTILDEWLSLGSLIESCARVWAKQ
jgi:hypothetical protein